MSDGYALDQGELSQTSTTLGTVASAVEEQTSAVRARPDAGQSSGEVAQAFAGLAQELQALAEAVSNLQGDVQGALSTYQQTDRGEAGRYRGAVPR